MKCFLCEGDENVHKFTASILEKCKLYLISRKKHNHKFSDVILPETCEDDSIGYHSHCYKLFYVIKKYLVDNR